MWFIATCFGAFANPVKISGKAPAYSNRKIIAYRCMDYVSMHKSEIAQSSIDAMGNFQLVFDATEIMEVNLKIDGVHCLLYVQPDANYSISIPAINENAIKSLSNNEIEILFDSLETYDINNLILDFEERIDAFVGYYFVIMGSKAYHQEIDTLKEYLSKVYKQVDNPWFKQYVFYSVASLEQVGGLNVDMNKLKMMLFAGYILKQDILYYHPKYMAFFNQFYTDVFKLADDKDERNLSEAINFKKSLRLLNEVLKKDEFLKEDKLRELVIIKALGEEYYSYNYYQENIISILDSIQTTSIFPEHKIIAKNMIDKLTRISVGYTAPDFRLVSNKQTEIVLSQLKGKYVYLHFWASWHAAGQNEMKIMAELHKKYGRDVYFLSVNMDEDPEKWKNFLKIHPEMNWTHVHYANQPQLFELYGLQTLSQYYLIGPDGKFLQSPAYKPTPNGSNISIDKTFFEIYRKLHPNGK